MTIPAEIQLIWTLALTQGRSTKGPGLDLNYVAKAVEYIKAKNTISLRYTSYLLYGMSLILQRHTLELLRNTKTVSSSFNIRSTKQRSTGNTTIPLDERFSLDFALTGMSLPNNVNHLEVNESLLMTEVTADASSILADQGPYQGPSDDQSTQSRHSSYRDNLDHQLQLVVSEHSEFGQDTDMGVAVPSGLFGDEDYGDNVYADNASHTSTQYSIEAALLPHILKDPDSDLPLESVLAISRGGSTKNTEENSSEFIRIPLKRRIVPNEVTELTKSQLVERDTQYGLNMETRHAKRLMSHPRDSVQQTITTLLIPFGLDHEWLTPNLLDATEVARESSPDSIQLQRDLDDGSVPTRTSYATSSATGDMHLSLNFGTTPSITMGGGRNGRLSLLGNRTATGNGSFMGSPVDADYFNDMDMEMSMNYDPEAGDTSIQYTIDGDRISSMKILDQVPARQTLDVLQFSVMTYSSCRTPQTLKAHVARTFYHLLILTQLEEIKIRQCTPARVEFERCDPSLTEPQGRE